MPAVPPSLTLFRHLHLSKLEKLGLVLGVSGAVEAVAGTALLLHGGFTHNVAEQKLGAELLLATSPSLTAALLIWSRPLKATHASIDV